MNMWLAVSLANSRRPGQPRLAELAGGILGPC